MGSVPGADLHGAQQQHLPVLHSPEPAVPREQLQERSASWLDPRARASCPSREVAASEQGALTFLKPDTAALCWAQQKLAAEPQYPRAGRLSIAPKSRVPFLATERTAGGGAEPVPGPRWQQMSQESSQPRRTAGAAKCDSSISPADRQQPAPCPGAAGAGLAPTCSSRGTAPARCIPLPLLGAQGGTQGPGGEGSTGAVGAAWSMGAAGAAGSLGAVGSPCPGGSCAMSLPRFVPAPTGDPFCCVAQP